jgi:hypothetical protein
MRDLFEPVGNHARKNHYQPGALIYRDVDTVYTGGGDFNAAALAAWTVLPRALTISYTPPVAVDCTALLIAQVECSHSLTNQAVGFRIYETGAAAAVVTRWIFMPPVATWPIAWNVAQGVELTAGVAYTFRVEYYIFAATLTIVEAADETFLKLRVHRIP